METVWQTTTNYVHLSTGELISRDQVKNGYYSIVKTDNSFNKIIKHKTQYNYVNKTYFCERTNQGKQLYIEGI